MVLRGRKAETAELDDLLTRARTGLSGTVVISGPAGIGKSALLDYATTSATDLQVGRTAGIEAEQELGFAALHRLLRPFLGRRGRLPGPQRDALETAFGLLHAAPPDRFLVGLATLTLLAEAAATKPVLAVCDDAQWMDRESLEVLAFVARRLHADAIVMLFGVRDDDTALDSLTGLPELRLSGLPGDEALALLQASVDTEVDRVIAAQRVAETDGNPLAILELGRSLARGEAAEPAFGQPLSLDGRLKERFLRQVVGLDTLTQQVLLVAAADATSDPVLLRQAMARLASASPAEVGTALERAEDAELLTDGARFRHPLIRSAVYGAATSSRRRQVHAALAEATDPVGDADRHAWHLAAAADGPDEEVATRLEAGADRARERGGHLAQAAFLRRAAELTRPGPQRNGRLLAACGAALTAGAPHRAEELLDLLTPDLGVPFLDALAMRLRGFLNVMLGRPGAVTLLLQAAQTLSELDPRAGQETLLEAMDAAIVVARIGPGMSAKQVAQAALAAPRAVPAEPREPGVGGLLLAGHAMLISVGYAQAVPLMRRGVNAMLAADEHGDASRWFLLGAVLALDLWDIDALGAGAHRFSTAARRQGALRMLQAGAHGSATHALLCGRLAAAEAHFAEFMDIAAAIGADLRFAGTSDVLLHAWRGDRERTLAAVAVQAGPESEQPGGLQVQFARTALVVLELGHRRYAQAQAAAEIVYASDPPHYGGAVLPDLVEAAVRNDDLATAQRALQRLSERAEASGTAWALGLLARSRALVTGDDQLYLRAHELLAATPLAPERARTHLLYGEWLRRRHRRSEARQQLRAAYELFAGMGATAFAERARIELAATGEHARTRDPSTVRALTPQELRVAQLAAAGVTNQEIAAELFISASTVEYHLRKVFRKLDVTSRRQLKDVMDA
ncbi:helix-turn-helix transcriptional regulator [Planobispora rosea]|uniref:helix-turn-helix transcriptional regulator n=1 Tax=Planobispora rosea TaxID=35762 RepID=UPI00083B4473|nr:LuxR family transcriptional regulator [Planobispora rosea]